MSATNYLKHEFLDIIWDENDINQVLYPLKSLAVPAAIPSRENSSELRLDPRVSKKVKTQKSVVKNTATSPRIIKSTAVLTRVKKFLCKILNPAPTGKAKLDTEFGMGPPAKGDATALFQLKPTKNVKSLQSSTLNWRGISSRAGPGVRDLTRIRPSHMRNCDLDRLRQHRRKVRQARRQMCFFWLFKKKMSKELSAISAAPITPLKIMATPKIGQSSGVSYLNIEGLRTPGGLNDSAGPRLRERPHSTPKVGINHNPNKANYPFRLPSKRDSKTQTVQPLHHGALAAERLEYNSLEMAAQMTAAITNNKSNSMRSGLLFRNSMEGVVNFRGQMSPIHKLERYWNNSTTSYSGEGDKVSQLYELSNKGKKKDHVSLVSSSSALILALTNSQAGSDEFSAEIGFRSLTAAHGEDFNQRLVGTLGYLFEEYMTYPLKAYHSARQSYQRQTVGYSNRQSLQASLPNKLRDFARVNHAFWEYVGALVNTLDHRDWLFDYLGVIISEFANLVAWWKRKPKDDGLGFGSGHGSWQLDRRLDEANALRAVRTSCYLICKLFDSSHNELELHQFCHGSINGRKEEGLPFGKGINTGRCHFTTPILQCKRGSCFEQLLEISKEEYGMGPTARLALTYVISRVQMSLGMMLSLKRAREKDRDYFRVYRIPLRCYMMVWLKLILLPDNAKIKPEKNRGKTGDESYERDGKATRSEIRQLADLEVRTVIALEHNTTIRELYFQLFPNLNTK